MEFEWDPVKAASNWRKHQVEFDTASKVFLDPWRYEYDQPDDDDGLRSNVIGIVEGRMLHVTYTLRGAAFRIISARPATRHEKRRYHEA